MKMAADEQFKERDVFKKHYASLCNTLTDINTLLPYFVSENIITSSDHEEINVLNVTSKKVAKLLSHISGPLEAGDTKGFYIMLNIMKEHGSQGTKDLADKIMEYEAVGQVSSGISHHHTPSSAASSAVTTPDPLSVQFSKFVNTIEALLEKCHDKLEQSKRICLHLTISGNSNELLFNDKQLQKINACTTFNELFTILRKHWSLSEYSILKEIITTTDLKEAKDELKLFKKRMGSYEGMKVISENIQPEAISREFIMLSVIIDQPYQELTFEDFTKLRDFIFEYLDVEHYTALPHIKYLLGSLHLQWYVLKKAVPHMIKMAQQNEEIFTSNSVVFIQVDQYVVFDYKAKDKTQIDDPKSTSSAYSSGGYDYNFLDPPPDRLVCRICQLPCRETQQSKCCGNVYCKSDIDRLKASTTMKPTSPVCCSEEFTTYPNLSTDREIQRLMVYCPDKDNTGCNWTGKLEDVDKHYSKGKECETECDKCKTIVKHKLLHSHIKAECPCYCPYCDITAEREVISSEHKEKCCKFPNYIGVDNPPQDKFDFNETSNPSILALLRKCTSRIKEITTGPVQTTKEKTDKQKHTTLMDRLCNISSYLTIAVLIIAILIAFSLLLLSPYEDQLVEHHTKDNTLYIYLSRNVSSGISLLDQRHLHEAEMKQTPQVTEHSNSLFSEQNEEINREMIHKLNETNVQVNLEDVYRYKQNFSELQQQITPMQEMIITVTNRQYHYHQLNTSEWSVESLLLSETSDQVAPFIIRMHNLTKKVWNKEEWYSNPFFAFEGGYQMCLKVFAAGYGDGEGTHVSVYLHLMEGPHDDKLEQSGHWPLRGTFTIELLNQLNDNIHMAQFHHHLCKDCTNRVLEGSMAKAGHSIPQFISHDTLYNDGNDYYKSDSLIFRISYEDIEPPYQVAPVTFKFTHFSQWLKNKEVWYSSPFFAFEGGYQFCLKVFTAGYGNGEGTHVSVYLFLMKGLYDNKLEQSGHWPLRGTFTIELLNQLNDSDHHSHMLQFHHNFCGQCTTRVLEEAVADSGCGYTQFISHDALLHHAHNNSYYTNNNLIFRISYEHMEPPYQITPVDFKLSKFSQWLKNKEVWYSSPFFAFEGGYQLCLKVFTAGYGDGEGTHVSVYLFLMKGPHDDKLEQSGHWPLRGTFTIELLDNQLNDSDHYTYKVQFQYSCREYSIRVLEEVMACQGCGYARFISHDTLFQHSNGSHYKNDFLIFKISYEHMEPPHQIAPVTFKLSKFSQWLKSKEEWYSSPFFAFEEGYQLCLKVYAAGNGIGEGTHVSVYIFLMKGPHDDKLEQSGHWPLRGTFTIELLNQLNDSDHYSDIVQFHHHLCNECTNRVLEEFMASSGRGQPQLISHDTLLRHGDNDYYKNDSLIFRISYEDIEPPYQIAPVTFKVAHFSQWLKSKEVWYSSPFFAFEEGYQMHLKVYPADERKGTHVSVYLDLTKGPHDDKLEQSSHWPLRGTFTIELLNQFNDSGHYSCIVQFHHHQCSQCTSRVLEEVMAYSGRGESHFISYDVLFHNSDYYKNNSLVFRISYEDVEPPHQIAPITFKQSKFSQWLKSKERWYSSPFFAFEEGYQLCLKVYAAGNGIGEGTHVSVYIFLMKGPHDDKLEQSGHWPLRGTFTIELLNQLNDSDHYSHMEQFHHHLCTECTNRVLEGFMASSGRGQPQLISHDTLLYHGDNDYYKSDSLIFRISYEDIEPPYQVAPVTFKFTHFSQWLKSKEVWYSSPFFAFEEGYQMHLKVYPADERKGTHVSVYLDLTKGPHDDKLEQSGHWPLRGTFTIELLNHLNKSDHFSCMVQFHHHRCSECTNRVLKEVMVYSGHGKPRFISHDALLHNNDYYRNDSLIFRISFEHMEPLYQIIPVTFKLSKFSQWAKSKEIWLSSPFFAFKEGYQMFLSVNAGGYDDGEGTHVSVYLYLMKGPHDDKLEQSGHWPLRGTFTIELLNQLNDSDHYSPAVIFILSGSGKRVIGDEIDAIEAVVKYISHDTLFKHSGYLKDDTIHFRISSDDGTKGNFIHI